jgi:SNF2 family DNA or RNA helicase
LTPSDLISYRRNSTARINPLTANLHDLSRAETSTFPAKVPEGKTLYPFQRGGVEYLYRSPKSFLADEMGLGKSPQAIAAMNTLGVDKYLIICPALLRENWHKPAPAAHLATGQTCPAEMHPHSVLWRRVRYGYCQANNARV